MEMNEKKTTPPAEGDKASVSSPTPPPAPRSEERCVTSSAARAVYFVRYRVNQIPPFPVALAVAIQHLLVTMASAMTISTVVGNAVCADPNDPIRARLMATTMFMSGLSTVLQSALGIRLGVFQGASSAFIAPLTVLGHGDWSCSDTGAAVGSTANASNTTDSLNNTADTLSLSVEEKLRQLSGSLMVASLLEILIGGLGLTRFLLRYIGPLTVAPTVMLIGFSLYKLPANFAAVNPPLAVGSVAVVVVFTLYLSKVEIPLPCKTENRRARFPLFQIMPILLAIMLMWLLCYIFTITDVFPDDANDKYYRSRTDAKDNIVRDTPWILAPYPGQFGMPSFNLAAFVGFIAAFMASAIESVGDYFGSSRSSQVMPPPDHAVSRGILVEGICGFLSGAVGAAHATTSYSQNVGLIRLTRTASRSVVTGAGIILILMSLIGKFGAALATLPLPILAATFLVALGMVATIGLSYLECADMTSNRNLMIVGIALMSGLAVPHFVQTNTDKLATGDVNADQLIRVFLGTPMFLGGMIAFFLDNTVPGTNEERGLKVWRKALSAPGSDAKEHKAKETKGADSTQTTGDAARGSSARSPIPEGGPLELSEDEVYSFMCLKGRFKSRFLRFIPFLPPNLVDHEILHIGSQESVDAANKV